MNQNHTQESLAALTRNQLVALATENKIAAPEGRTVSSTKSAVLIASILAAQPQEVPPPAVEAAAPSPVGKVVPEVVAVVEVQEAAPVAVAEASNVVPFEVSPEVAQAELPTPEPVTPATSMGIFKIQRSVFQQQISAAAKLTNQSKMPILSCVLIGFSNNRLSVHGTNLDMYVVTEAQAETTGSYQIAIPAGVLAKFVSKCSSEFLMAEVRGCSLHISDLENRTEIMGIPYSEWPGMLEIVEPRAVMEISGKQFSRVITETIKCASTDETRYILNGICVDLSSGISPSVVTTDGRRLAIASLGASKTTESEGVRKIIIPTNSASILRAGLPLEVAAIVRENKLGNRLLIESESVGYKYTAVIRLVDGNFPHYQQVTPKDFVLREVFTVDRTALLEVIGRLMVLQSDKSDAIKYVFTASAVKMSIASDSVGDGVETLAVSGGTPKTSRIIALSGRYVAEILASWGDEKITLSVNGADEPLLINGADKLAVVMPVRLT